MPTIRELVEEAEENYGTGRHGNSGPLFKRAGLQAMAHGATPDALYLLYRALLDFEKIGQPVSQLQLLEIMLTEIAKIIKVDASQLLQHSDGLDDEEIIKVLKFQLKSMEILQEEEDQEVVRHALQKEYTNLYNKTDQSRYLEDALELQYSNSLLGMYLSAVLHDAEETLSSGSFDVELVALARVLQALQYLPPKYHHDFRQATPDTKPAELGLVITKVQIFLNTLISSSLQEDLNQVEHMMQRYDVEFLEFLLP